MSLRITCIKKQSDSHQDPHHAIERVGWIEEDGKSGSSTRIEIYDWIREKKGQAYVRDRFGNSVQVGAAISSNGTKFIRTYADGKWTDNLLALPECN
jgi:hypothetical protein